MLFFYKLSLEYNLPSLIKNQRRSRKFLLNSQILSKNFSSHFSLLYMIFSADLDVILELLNNSKKYCNIVQHALHLIFAQFNLSLIELFGIEGGLGIWYKEASLLNSQLTFSKGHLKIAQFVQKHSESPNVRLGRDQFVRVQIDHFWRPVGQSRVLLNLVGHHLNRVGGRVLPFVENVLGRRAKVAQHKNQLIEGGAFGAGLLVNEYVLYLKVSVYDGGRVQLGQGHTSVAQNFHYLWLLEARALRQTLVHQLN
ncbi:hypothetical protein BpHYR1_012691 [Brachionus plicatilis]|uniref:Uncharacterized protein n=1 Tax=Brachionus plicatilis TaxID=10195 RepID=A0A3M7SN19_BRAPC|nr:hypothetical protein BpHYR1_012691 [Brachionus plicatilis]